MTSRPTSGGYGYWLGQSLAVAYVDVGMAAAGTRLAVEILWDRRPTMVLSEPLYDPDRLRPRG